jgi:hypothetical protein
MPCSAGADLGRARPTASYLGLVYHEARNVRHLVNKGFLARGAYEQVLSLPGNREDAWAAIQVIRTRAARSGSAKSATDVFAIQFGLSLEELVDLYEDRHWRHSAVGGNRWSGITRSLIELRDALDQDDAVQAADLFSRIPAMLHNTGQVEQKLSGLDAALRDMGPEK